MTVRVDEPGRHYAPERIDHGRRAVPVDAGQISDGEDPITEHADVGGSTRGAGAVDDGAAANEQVEGRHARMMPPHKSH